MSSAPSAPSAPKTIILAFDGTLKKFGKKQTNLLRLYGLFDKLANLDEQVVYYQPGVGTYLAEGTAWSPFTKALQEKLDSAFARYLDTHVGLLPPDNDFMVASAYERYLDTSFDGIELARKFKEQLGRRCPIEFLGLWDTVSSVGLITSRHLPLSASNFGVKTVRHALALDERRSAFRHNSWYGTPKKDIAEEEGGQPSQSSPPLKGKVPSDWPYSSYQLPPSPQNTNAVDAESQSESTDVKEVWFAGCHSDVGGGHDDLDASNTISDPSLSWMINQILVSGVLIRFSTEALNKLQGFNHVPGNPLPTPPKDNDPNPSIRRMSSNSNLQSVEQREVGLNATSRIHDELKSSWFWWALEGLPSWTSSFDRTEKKWKERYAFTWGSGRKIWEVDVLIHESVRQLMREGPYRPMATFERRGPHVQFVADSGEITNPGVVEKGCLVLEPEVRAPERKRRADWERALSQRMPPEKPGRSFLGLIAAYSGRGAWPFQVLGVDRSVLQDEHFVHLQDFKMLHHSM
ncbi:hypothetical protein FRC01_002954 [Tulasnella sp. 417]|nr:hypothetical protein FRC01_002954 [Tulasnella sp. 417]